MPVLTVGSFIVTGDERDGAGKFKIKCTYCHELHYSASCERVTDREARVKLLRDSKRCFVCLRVWHQASKCDSTKKCRHCSGRHHQSICPSHSHTPRHTQGDNPQKPDDEKEHANRNPKQLTEVKEHPTIATITHTTKGSVLLQTARANVSNESKSAPARILFDTGSQRSYIRKSLQHRLGLNPIGKETLQLNTFGENESKRENCDVFKINLANKSGGSSVEITAIGFPTICAPLPSSIDASEYPHLDGLELADFDPCSSSSHNDSIDILVGADHYCGPGHR